MARSLRILAPGVWYHVVSRGVERRAIFRDDRDRRRFLELLEGLAERHRVRVFAYVLMDNHYHLLLGLREENLSAAMRWLNLSYSVWFNLRHRRAGYLFQGRFKSVLAEPAAWGVRLSGYIHLNPARLEKFGLSKGEQRAATVSRIEAPSEELIQARLAALRGHRWSSYGFFVGTRTAPPWLEAEAVLELMGGKAEGRRAEYRRGVENQLRQGVMPSPWEELRERVFLGGEEFVAKLLKGAAGGLGKKEGMPGWARKPAGLAEVIAAVESVRGERWADFRDRHGDSGRDLVIFLARRATNLTLAALARELGAPSGASVSIAGLRYEKRLGKDRKELQKARQAGQMLNVAI